MHILCAFDLLCHLSLSSTQIVSPFPEFLLSITRSEETVRKLAWLLSFFNSPCSPGVVVVGQECHVCVLVSDS